jgi:TusA-related sulfurtransferase
MEPNVELDCRGMKCPRPIIEIAKLARRSPPGTVVRIMADDLAFESDVRAWCENAKATVVSLTKEEERSVAIVKLAE